MPWPSSKCRTGSSLESRATALSRPAVRLTRDRSTRSRGRRGRPCPRRGGVQHRARDISFLTVTPITDLATAVLEPDLDRSLGFWVVGREYFPSFAAEDH